MDNLTEWLVPLIFIVIWALSKMFGRGSAEEEEGPATAESDRTREIQEEIRRRIAERQSQREPPPVPQQPARRRSGLENEPARGAASLRGQA